MGIKIKLEIINLRIQKIWKINKIQNKQKAKIMKL